MLINNNKTLRLQLFPDFEKIRNQLLKFLSVTKSSIRFILPRTGPFSNVRIVDVSSENKSQNDWGLRDDVNYAQMFGQMFDHIYLVKKKKEAWH